MKTNIKAAKAAGMKAVAVTTTHKKQEFGLADRVVGSFKGLSSLF
jgi:beta-phosphoglucomutase-like phosphatase (HAD superfamily)